MKGLGFLPPSRPPSKLERERHEVRMASVSIGAALGPSYLAEPTILDQGGAGACTGFAAVQCAHLETGAPIGSPAFSYYNNRLCMGGAISDSGADPDSVQMALNQFGIAPAQDMAYTDDPVGINNRPPDLAYIAAQQLKCTLSPILESGSLLFDAISHVIAVEKKPVFLAIEVVPSYDNSTNTHGYADSPDGPSRGQHAVAAYGQDPSYIWTAGSWGKSFGRNGIVLLSKAYITANCVYAAGFSVE